MMNNIYFHRLDGKTYLYPNATLKSDRMLVKDKYEVVYYCKVN